MLKPLEVVYSISVILFDLSAKKHTSHLHINFLGKSACQ